jgi:hypothetical protein
MSFEFCANEGKVSEIAVFLANRPLLLSVISIFYNKCLV